MRFLELCCSLKYAVRRLENYPSYYYCLRAIKNWDLSIALVSALHGVDMTDDLLALFPSWKCIENFRKTRWHFIKVDHKKKINLFTQFIFPKKNGKSTKLNCQLPINKLQMTVIKFIFRFWSCSFKVTEVNEIINWT